MANEKPEQKSRLVMTVLRDLLRQARFPTIADLKDVLKFRLARLRIRTEPCDVDDAISIVTATFPLARPEPSPSRESDAPDGRLIGPGETKIILEKIRARLQLRAEEVQPKHMTDVRELAPNEIHHLAVEKRLTRCTILIFQALIDQQRACDEAEQVVNCREGKD